MPPNNVTKTEWNQFVEANKGTVYHLYEWSDICRSALGYKPGYFGLFDNSKLGAIYPLVERGKISRRLCMMPLSDGIAPLKTDTVSWDQVLASLPLKATDIFFSKQLTGKTQTHPASQAIYSLTLAKDYPNLFETSFHHKTRNMVRKSEKSDLVLTASAPDPKRVSEFFSLYQKTMHKLGVVSLPKSFFTEVVNHLGPKVILISAFHFGKPASFLWLFDFGTKLYVWANGSDQSLLHLGSNYAVYNAAIKLACDLKKTELVFGSSEIGSSQAFFKQRWGAQEHPQHVLSQDSSGIDFVKPLITVMPNLLYQPFSDLAFKLI